MSNLLKKFNIPLYEKNKILETKDLSNAFGSFCKKILLDNGKKIVIKGRRKKEKYNSIYYEGKSIEHMYKNFPKLFPKLIFLNNNVMVMKFIDNNKIKNKYSSKELAKKISFIHKIKSTKYGYNFNPPIGGMKQPSEYEISWTNFFVKKRLVMIYEKINKTKLMPKTINKNIEKIIKNIKNILPNNPTPSLIHGDLWDGNILFNNGRLVGLIDPGIYYAHNELEVAYINWFGHFGKNFIEHYNDYNLIDKEFYNYQEVYQLYFSLLNVFLWSREYIIDVDRLANKYS